MGERAEGPVNHSSGDVALFARRLAEALDQRSFFATLQEDLPTLLPATRLDIITSDQRGGNRLIWTYGGENDPLPLAGNPNIGSSVEWLSGHGYRIISTLPLIGAGQHCGWLLLARRREPFDPQTVALAGQLAALLALRLVYDQSRADLAAQEERASKIEQRLRDLEGVRLRATLAAGAAHDIGNLFAAVMGHAQLLQQGAPATMQADLQTIIRAARDGHHLMRRLVALRAAQHASPATPISPLPALIRDAIKLTQPFWEAKPGIVVETMLMPVPVVRGHAAELREVLINLIMNAVTAMPEGGTLAIRSYAVEDRVIVEVADTGEGIARAAQSAIFEPSVTTRESSAGLGLSVSRAIIEGYGGTLTVDSTPGHGATFAVSLPAVRSHDPLKAQPLSQKCVNS